MNALKDKNKVELDFIQDDQERISISIGAKGGGKTRTVLCLMKFFMSLEVPRYHRYHLIMPSYKIDNDQEQYDFLRGRKDVFIYTKYSPLVLQRVLNEQTAEQRKNNDFRTFFLIDDSTQYGSDLNSDPIFLNFMTTSRHLKIKIMAIYHACKKVLAPAVRANIDYLIIYKITNDKLLNDIYDEFFSMYPDFKNYTEFKKWYYDKIFMTKHNFIFMSLIECQFTGDGKDFFVCNHDFSPYFPHTNKQNVKVIEVDGEKDKIKQKFEQQEYKREIQNEAKKKALEKTKK